MLAVELVLFVDLAEAIDVYFELENFGLKCIQLQQVVVLELECSVSECTEQVVLQMIELECTGLLAFEPFDLEYIDGLVAFVLPEPVVFELVAELALAGLELEFELVGLALELVELVVFGMFESACEHLELVIELAWQVASEVVVEMMQVVSVVLQRKQALWLAEGYHVLVEPGQLQFEKCSVAAKGAVGLAGQERVRYREPVMVCEQ